LVEVQPNVRAQALRYLELLLHEPVAFDARCLPNVGLDESVEIRIPNPGTFVLQKALIGPERRPDKRAKDAAYVYDLAILTEGRWVDVAGSVRSVRNSSPERAKWLERATAWFGREYRSADSPLLGQAAGILEASNPDEAPTPEAMRRSLCRFFDAVGL
jgi:hypothetical protein